MSCKSGKGKCMRPGRVTSNGYLNFLREYRKKNCGMTAVQTVKKGAKAWNKLSCGQKAKYRSMGKKKPKRSRSRGRSCSKKRRSRPRKRSGCSRKSRRRPKRKGKGKRCMRPGRITNNGYLNFLREFRRKCCGLSPQETIRRGAKKWCSLSPAAKAKYNRGGKKRKC